MASLLDIGTNVSQPSNPSAGRVKLWIDSSAELNILESDGTNNTIAVGVGSGDMLAANNLSDLVSASTARTNLGLGTMAQVASPAPVINGGTGFSGYTTGDLLYASGSAAMGKLSAVASNSALISQGVGIAPVYGKIGLTTHISGILQTTNGGTGSSSTTYCALGTNVSGTLPILNGGTGATTVGAALAALGLIASNRTATLLNSWAGTLNISTDHNRNVHIYGYVTSAGATSDTVASLPLGAIPAYETQFTIGTAIDGYSLNGYITTAGALMITRSALMAPGSYVNVRFISAP